MGMGVTQKIKSFKRDESYLLTVPKRGLEKKDFQRHCA